MTVTKTKKAPERMTIAELRESGSILHVDVPAECLTAFKTKVKAKGMRMVDAVADALRFWMDVN